MKNLRGLLIGSICALIGGLAVAQALVITGTNSENQNSIFLMGIPSVARDGAITARAGGGQSSAYQLTAGLNRVTTVATGDDSVKLPVCQGGKVVIVINAAAANSLNVYGQTGETINALSPDAPFAIAANKMVVFACANDGNWYSNLTA